MLTFDSTSRMGRLQNKRVIVTGASGFIGRVVVSICLAEGAKVLAFDKIPFERIWVEGVARIWYLCLEISPLKQIVRLWLQHQ
jgi:NAD(P)-dependent dehydrogenase (short-subunit alcohol dehydrogenase family)